MAERPAASTKPVAQRLLLKAGSRALVLDAPPDYLDHFLTEVKVDQQLAGGPYDFIQLFATRRDTVLARGPQLRQALNQVACCGSRIRKAKRCRPI